MQGFQGGSARFVATMSYKVESQDLLFVAVTKGPVCRI